MIVRGKHETREQYMLRVAACYIREYCEDGEIDYDGTTCDGSCVAQDCEDAASE